MRPLRFLPLLALLGCQNLPAGAGGGPACDKAKLDALVTELAAMSPRDAAGRVWAGVREACGDSLTNAAAHLYDGDAFDREKAAAFKPDAQWDRMVAAACPGWDDEVNAAIAEAPADDRALVAYRGCDFARFDLLPEERFEHAGGIGIVSWSMHAWFLDQGLDPEAARTISRALFALEERVATAGMVPKGVELPVVKGEPLGEGIPLALSKDGVVFLDKIYASIEGGRIDPSATNELLITDLEDPLVEEADKGQMMAEARGSEWDSRLLLMADRGTTAEALTQVMYTAGQAQWRHFSLVVASEDGVDITQIPVEYLRPEPGRYTIKGPEHSLAEATPDFDAEAMARNAGLLDTGPTLEEIGAFLTIEVSADGYSIGRGRGAEPLEKVSGQDFGPLVAQAEKLKGEHPEAKVLVVSGDGDARVERLVAAIAAGRGQLPRVVIESARAHQFGTPPKLEGAGSSAVEVTVKGELEAKDIHPVVRANIKDVRACYYAGLAKDAELEGLVQINFVIAASGKVPTSVVQSSSLDDAEVGKCIARAVEKWTFPPPEGGGTVIVTYPFNLSAD